MKAAGLHEYGLRPVTEQVSEPAVSGRWMSSSGLAVPGCGARTLTSWRASGGTRATLACRTPWARERRLGACRGLVVENVRRVAISYRGPSSLALPPTGAHARFQDHRGVWMDLLVPEMPGVDPVANLALEEALVRAIPPGPVLRIWQNGACVVLGRGQRLHREANVAACAAAGVPVLRRASGGGAVYHDLGNLNITLAVPGWVPGLAGDLAALVAGVLRQLALTPSVTERGVFAGPVKVSGLASQLTRGATLAHATLLVATPAARVGAFLAPAPPDTRPLDSQRSQVLPLCEMVHGMCVGTAHSLVLVEAAKRHGALTPRPVSAAEMGWQRRLLAQRYENSTWHTTGRGPVARTEEAEWTTRPVGSCTG
jgi:lipoate---protein ligase